ncbi:MAG: peptidylprolyl isomerase [Lachnospiraceae bacterium]|nr:peptidylprolyl isomerase [Ruminococcus sp.]MCM1275310.1 peptidylprolyl isomerase [Lachnospiraceae bacterium]
MKLKNALMCAALAAGMLLTGCNNGDKSSGSGSSVVVDAESLGDFKGNMLAVTPKEGDLIATFEIEGFGTIKAVLFPEAAPVGVENFQKLCEAGYYKGLKIHRVISDFMFQGGSLNGDGTGGEALVNGGSFGIETNDNLRHFYGALCYANAGGQNSTQFYIVNNKTYDPAEDIELAEQTLAEVREMIKQSESNSDADAVEFYKSYEEAFTGLLKILPYYSGRGGYPGLDGSYTVFGQVYEGFDVIDSISAVEVEDSGNDSQPSKPVNDIIITNVYVSKYVEG